VELPGVTCVPICTELMSASPHSLEILFHISPISVYPRHISKDMKVQNQRDLTVQISNHLKMVKYNTVQTRWRFYSGAAERSRQSVFSTNSG
jgi:hypothetical protein